MHLGMVPKFTAVTIRIVHQELKEKGKRRCRVEGWRLFE